MLLEQFLHAARPAKFLPEQHLFLEYALEPVSQSNLSLQTDDISFLYGNEIDQ
ncbi:hypothetical protein DPMN_165305 [Dreissena polymorpha]|uniref:Uncharacterized protein n=1 Tax=Dreissena polymorpha TaxID=45954 RepID=A0A9D4F013_DREPO|nr:hypothetical protein DPMN_165305 [Dreissena polymorpha]